MFSMIKSLQGLFLACTVPIPCVLDRNLIFDDPDFFLILGHRPLR